MALTPKATGPFCSLFKLKMEARDGLGDLFLIVLHGHESKSPFTKGHGRRGKEQDIEEKETGF